MGDPDPRRCLSGAGLALRWRGRLLLSCQELSTGAMRPLCGRIRPLRALPRLTACHHASWGTDNAPARAVLPSLSHGPAGVSLHRSCGTQRRARLASSGVPTARAVPQVPHWDGVLSQCDGSGFCWWELRPQDCPKRKSRGSAQHVAVSTSPWPWGLFAGTVTALVRQEGDLISEQRHRTEPISSPLSRSGCLWSLRLGKFITQEWMHLSASSWCRVW